MNWIKKGKLFDPTQYSLANGCKEFAQSPQTVVFEDFVRIYFSTRKKDEATGKYLSFIAFIDVDKDFENILNSSSQEIIALGELGTFDEHGIFPINLLKEENRILAYSCGWNRRVSVSVETSIGLAISEDDGITFKKYGNGPIVSSSLKEPILVGDAFVQKYNEVYHMWYIFGVKWMVATETEPEARVYKIAHATSKNGIQWNKEEGIQIISDKLNENECQALPTVIKIGSRYHMYFCYREATDFRKNSKRSYKLGYAYSDDLKHWTRDDDNSGITTTANDWDSDMMCYPHIFECNSKVHLLYNGNEFGKYGFGIAELEQQPYK
ncbi:hypothetical protein ACFX5D_01680 [Flavobacterium sp. LB3P45]|uniref:Glycosyl hydrolases family 32 N-terminal domain-containing protein n=1 Tax=Flavobacterium fructosi TaxID=3230416 RepID=A0ABW6HI22_9FLAO